MTDFKDPIRICPGRVALTWETWALAGLGLLQFGVAYWWWRGPWLEGTRGWVTALFALNGASSLFTAAELAADAALAASASGLASVGTNVALLGVGLVGLGWNERRPRAHQATLGLEVVIAALAAAGLVAAESGASAPALLAGIGHRHLRSLSLTLAIVAGAAALLHRGRSRGDVAGPWLLAMAAVTFRFAELGAAFFNPARFVPDDRGLLATAGQMAPSLWLPVMAAAFMGLAWIRLRRDDLQDALFHDLALVLLAAGFFFGLARNSYDVPPLFAYLTLDLVRPAAFVGLQALLHPAPFRRTRQWAQLWQGSIVFVWVLAGFPLSRLLGLGTPSAVASSLGLGILALGLVIVLGRSRRRSARDPSSPRGATGADDRGPDWPLDPERVSLPGDWEDRVASGYEVYRDLDPSAQAALDDLARWERVVLALHAAPEGDRLPPYERTTPGLHLVTHAPYSSIGPEIKRTNERADRILDELGVAVQGDPSHQDEALVESTMGPAEGLSSPRVKSYALTDLGREAAQALAEQVDVDEDVLLDVLGEGYRDAGDR